VAAASCPLDPVIDDHPRVRRWVEEWKRGEGASQPRPIGVRRAGQELDAHRHGERHFVGVEK
jgi:hypothetical protein